MDCNISTCVWALEREDLVDFLCENQEQDAGGWLAILMESLSHDLTRVVVTLWAIWYTRRKAIHQQSFQSPLSSHFFIDRFISDLTMATPTTTNKERR